MLVKVQYQAQTSTNAFFPLANERKNYQAKQTHTVVNN